MPTEPGRQSTGRVGAPAPGRPVVELRNVRKSFLGSLVLEDVNLEVWPGQIHAVVGHNGAGKSTLMKILQGVHQADSGEVVLDGELIRRPSPSLLRSLGVGMVYQERSLVPTLTGLDNLFLNSETTNRARTVRRGREYAEASRICARLGVSPSLLSRYVGDLSAVEQEMLEVAKALRLTQKLVILDEPTGPLGASEVQDLFRVVRATASTGAGVILITHHLGEVFDIADYVTCLREGRVTLSAATSETNLDALVDAIVGDSLRGTIISRASSGTGAAAQAGDGAAQARDGAGPGRPAGAALEVLSLSVTGKFHDISFSISPGEVLGLAGLAGSGRSTLLKTLYGDIHASSGQVHVFGRRLTARHPHDAIRAGVYMVPEDRAVHGLVLDKPIVENVSLSILDRLRRFGVLVMSRAVRRAGSAIRVLGIRARSPNQLVSELSGGNQQKVVVAKAMQTEMRVLLLDEPTFGVDIGAAHDVAGFVREFVSAGNAALWASSDLHELVQVADRVLILADGKIREEIPRGSPELSEAGILAKMQRGDLRRST